MGEYLITIELHSASADDYKTLHEAMCDVGFHRLIVINEHKRRLVLPIAIYRGWSLHHLEEVLAAVKAAANATVRLNKVYCALVAASSISFDEF